METGERLNITKERFFCGPLPKVIQGAYELISKMCIRDRVEAAGLGHERERAGHECLACDDRGAGGEDDAERADHLGQHLEERVEAVSYTHLRASDA